MSTFASRPRGRQPDPDLAVRWQQRLQRYRTSGLTVAAFCVAEGISTASFYLWQRRRRTAPNPPAQPTPGFVPVHLHGPATTTPLELLLPHGLVLRRPPAVDPHWLRQLLRLDPDTPC